MIPAPRSRSSSSAPIHSPSRSPCSPKCRRRQRRIAPLAVEADRRCRPSARRRAPRRPAPAASRDAPPADRPAPGCTVLIGPAGIPACSNASSQSAAGRVGDDLGDHRHQRVARGDPRRIGRKARIVRPLRVPKDGRQPCELAVIADGDDDRLVRRLEWLVGHDIGMPGTLPHRILRRSPAHWTPGWRASPIGCRTRPCRSSRPRPSRPRRTSAARMALAVYMPVNRSATATPTRIGPPPGFAIGQAGQAHQPAHRLDDVIVAGPRAHRARPGRSR